MLSSLVDAAVDGEPSAITRRGKRVAVILGFAEWQRSRRAPSFGQLLMSAPISAGDLPPDDTDRLYRPHSRQAHRWSPPSW